MRSRMDEAVAGRILPAPDSGENPVGRRLGEVPNSKRRTPGDRPQSPTDAPGAAETAEPPDAGVPLEEWPAESGSGSAEEPLEDLPPVEELVKRIRPEVLAAMDELFRPQWTGVKRLRAEDLPGG